MRKRPYKNPNFSPLKGDELNPSEVTETAWIQTFRNSGEYYSSNPTSGKWLIFTHISEVDELWKKIKKATEDGLLGATSKVSTSYDNPNAKNNNEKVICVYTYDIEDIEDVMRIRQNLRNLGVEKKIHYKLDSKTAKGIYSVNGELKISSYFI